MLEDEHGPLDTQRMHSLRGKLRGSRTLVLAFIASVIAHALFVVVMNVATMLNLPFAIDFTPSSGVGMMSRIGRFYEGQEITSAPRYTNITIELPPSPPAEAPTEDDVTPDDDAALSEATADPDGTPSEDATGEDAGNVEDTGAAAAAQAEADAQAALARAEARKRRRERERLAQQQADAKAAQEPADAEAKAAAAAQADASPTNPTDPDSDTDADGKGEANAGPNLDLPPGQRYPAGTINPIATDLGMWGPEGARVVVVTRNDRLRSSPHVESVRTLLQSFPDWRTLAGGASLDPINDIDTLIVASADPRYINQTFLAAVHHVPAERVIDTLSSGHHGGVRWEEEKGRLIGRPQRRAGDGADPRVFFVPSEQIFVFTRPEFMDGLRGGAPTPRNMEGALARALEPAAPAADGTGEDGASLNTGGTPSTTHGEKPAGSEVGSSNAAAGGTTSSAPEGQLVGGGARAPRPIRPDREPPLRDAGWIRGLMQVADYGGVEKDGPAVMVSTGSIDDMRIQGYRGVMPRSLHANVYADADVRITARALFEDRAQAESFNRAWPDILEANRSALTLAGLYRSFSEAVLTIDHNESILQLTIPQATMRRLAVTVSQLMETR